MITRANMSPVFRFPDACRLSVARRGFSLAEVAMAMGIVTVGILSLAGVLSTLMDTDQGASRATLLAAVRQQISHHLHSRPFASLPFTEPDATATDDSAMAQVESAPLFFDSDGAWISPLPEEWPVVKGADLEAPLMAVCRCVVLMKPDASTLDAPIPGAMHRTNLLRITLQFFWLDRSAEAPPNAVFHETLAKY